MRGINIPTNLVTTCPETAALSAVQLAANFRSGWSPPPVQVPFALQPDETCVGLVNAGVEQRPEADGTDLPKPVAWAGSLSELVLGRAMGAIASTRRRSKAAPDATERWRYVDTFWIYVTTARIALKGDCREWYDFWYSSFRTLGYDQNGVILQVSGSPVSRLRMEPPDYWFVMVRMLAFNEIHDNPIR